MKKLILLTALLLPAMTCVSITLVENVDVKNAQKSKDSIRLAQLDEFWVELSRSVGEGDIEAYEAAYHEDAVVIFASGTKKMSLTIKEALIAWRQGFTNTKNGKTQDSAEFRFSQRIGNESTAFETGIFVFKSADVNGKVTAKYIIHFEMLLVKRENKWLAMMEHQRANATEEEWEALK